MPSRLREIFLIDTLVLVDAERGRALSQLSAENVRDFKRVPRLDVLAAR